MTRCNQRSSKLVQRSFNGHQYYVVLFIILYMMVLTFISVDGTLVYDHSKNVTEQYFYVMHEFEGHLILMSGNSDKTR